MSKGTFSCSLELVMIVQVEMSQDMNTATQLCTLSPFISWLHLPLVLILQILVAQHRIKSEAGRKKKKNKKKIETERKKEFKEEKNNGEREFRLRTRGPAGNVNVLSEKAEETKESKRRAMMRV